MSYIPRGVDRPTDNAREGYLRALHAVEQHLAWRDKAPRKVRAPKGTPVPRAWPRGEARYPQPENDR